MGLDMYLTKKTYIGAEYEHRDVKAEVNITIMGEPVKIDPKKITYIQESAAYWRKANHIHDWFVQNVQDGEDDCKEYYVSKENMQELLDTCKTVAKSLKDSPVIKKKEKVGFKDGEDLYEEFDVFTNTEVAEELLPTSPGFFFGGTEYGRYYLEDVEETIKILEVLLESVDSRSEFYYQASW